VKVTGPFKQGDRVPPGGTFDYTWNTFAWPTTAGVWLYHDHSVCDMDNVEHGAIGIIVIHNPNDIANEVDIRIDKDPNNTLDPAFLPQGTLNASPIETICFPIKTPFPFGARVLPHDLAGLGATAGGGGGSVMPGMGMAGNPAGARAAKAAHAPKGEPGVGPPISGRTIQQGNLLLELDDKFQNLLRLCTRFYTKPPSKALYLQLYHTLGDAAVCINGRKYLGNTPTLIARPRQGAEAGTKMRFGVVGMGSMFHTFHIHGHRWILPGPTGTNLNAIQSSLQTSPVSQFEDTRTFGPANSFVFTIDEDSGLPSFFRAEPSVEPSIGEWHMHCHVLDHMMQGMMGSLLVVTDGTVANPLPSATLVCPGDVAGMPGMGGMGSGPQTTTVHIVDFQFNPDPVAIHVGDTVQWIWDASDHSTTSDTSIWDSGVLNTGATFSHTFTSAGSFPYYCKIHGAPGGGGMHGTVSVT
jgi:plastocyanin